MKLVKIYLAHWALGGAVAIETPATIEMPILKGEKVRRYCYYGTPIKHWNTTLEKRKFLSSGKKDVFVNIALRVMYNLAAMGPKHLGRGYNHVLHVNATEIRVQNWSIEIRRSYEQCIVGVLLYTLCYGLAFSGSRICYTPNWKFRGRWKMYGRFFWHDKKLY